MALSCKVFTGVFSFFSHFAFYGGTLSGRENAGMGKNSLGEYAPVYIDRVGKQDAAIGRVRPSVSPLSCQLTSEKKVAGD